MNKFIIMYPFVIIWISKNLEEHYNDNYYGCVEELKLIDKILFDFVDEIIKLHKDKIENAIYFCEDFNWTNFCETINNEPYNDSIFFNIKYFNIQNKKWIDYEIDNSYLERKFIKLMTKIFNKKINLSQNVTNSIDKVNKKKNKKIIEQKNIKEILTIEF